MEGDRARRSFGGAQGPYMRPVKRAWCIIMAALMFCAPVFLLAGCAARSGVLKLYLWSGYIDAELLSGFEDWYARETGESVKVEFDTYDSNEYMMTRLEVQRADYDLVCPSDYMAERMIKSGLAQKIDKRVFDAGEDGLFYDGLKERMVFDRELDYFVPYVWGTIGILYDINYISPDDPRIKSWAALWSSDWRSETGRRHIYIKDGAPDAFSAAMVYGHTDILSELSHGFTDYNAEYFSKLEWCFYAISDELIDMARELLIRQKPEVAKYESGDGRDDLVSGVTDARLGMFWSSNAELIMQSEGGEHFFFDVPIEGSNIWVDGWLITSRAVNVKAANYFIKYVNMREFTSAIFDYVGNSMANKAAMADAYERLSRDDAGFFSGKPDGFREMFLNTLFPPADVLARCATMRDYGKKWATELDGMWIDVKTM